MTRSQRNTPVVRFRQLSFAVFFTAILSLIFHNGDSVAACAAFAAGTAGIAAATWHLDQPAKGRRSRR